MQDNQVKQPNQGHPFLFAVFFVALIIFIFFAAYSETNEDFNIFEKKPENYFEIIEKEENIGFFSMTYDVTIETKKDMDSLTLIAEFYNDQDVIITEEIETHLNLVEGQQYLYSFEVPFGFNVSKVRVNYDDAVIN